MATRVTQRASETQHRARAGSGTESRVSLPFPGGTIMISHGACNEPRSLVGVGLKAGIPVTSWYRYRGHSITACPPTSWLDDHDNFHSQIVDIYILTDSA